MYSHSPLLNAILRHSAESPVKTAIIIGEKTVTYSELEHSVRSAAAHLASMSIGFGSTVILSAHKDVEFIYLYLAVQLLGGTNVIVDAELNKERLEYIENKIGPDYCFGYLSSHYPSALFSDIPHDSNNLYIDDVCIKGLSADSIAEILFTTGTTGAPKGVCLSFNNVYASACNINDYIQNSIDDVELLGLPICHSFGLGRIRCTLIKGGTIVILGSFANMRLVLKTIEQHGITGFGVVPAAWAYIRKISGRRIEKYAQQIRYIEIGSASMPIPVKEEMLEMFPSTRICMHYGLTEASRSCFQEFHDHEHIGSIGKAVCDAVDVKVFDSNGKVLPEQQIGEICVRGNMVMRNYLDPNDTQNAFWSDYFRTGDCGYLSRDGYIYLVGREKELINVGGKKVSPMEVEDAICSLGIGDCVCVPMKDTSGIMGELVKCCILKGSTELSFEEIAERLAGRLEPYKRPVVYEWIDSIPQTTSGKKQRLLLK